MRDMMAETAKTYALKDDFAQARAQFNKEIVENAISIKHLQDTIDILGRTITKDIYSAVKKATSHL